ncbi:MAG TPA: hypothetical protein VLA10_03580 [Ilumatobacter sp.]|nr:hypothetical protein [Ilumatobacter sp.]
MTDWSPPSEDSLPEVRSAPLPTPADSVGVSSPGGDLAPDSPTSGGRPGAPDPAPPLAYPGRPPRSGELTIGWRIVTAVGWIGAILAFATVWNVSRQLGLSTWWLGTRAQPQLRVVQLSPFLCPALMLLGAINRVRWLGWFGLIAAGVLAGYGVVDLGQVSSIAFVELLIAGLVAALSIASLTGTYRRDPAAAAALGD